MHIHKKHKYDIIVILAALAAAVSLYLAVTHYLGFAVPCDITHGCETVLSSRYSYMFGVPLSVIGVVYFFCMVVLALLANHYEPARKILTWALGAGALAALCFLGIQFFVLKKVCQYCLATDSISIAMFLWDLNIEHKRAEQN